MRRQLQVLVCDGAGCGAWSTQAGFSTARAARSDAKKKGWYRVNWETPALDLCPECWAKADAS